MSEDDWRDWAGGRRDNRYRGVKKPIRMQKRRKGPIIGAIIAGIVIVSFFLLDWTEALRFVNQQIEEKKPFDTAKKNVDETIKVLEPLISEPYLAEPPKERAGSEEQAERFEEKPSPKQITPQLRIMDLEQEVHQWINHYRKQNALLEISFNLKLTDIARTHSQDMANNNYFSHTNKQGQDPTDRAVKAGFHCRIDLPNGWYVAGVGENLWQGWTYRQTINGIPSGHYTQSELAKQVVDSWMSSPGHRQNILTDYWKSDGIGIAITQSGKVYATQMFC